MSIQINMIRKKRPTYYCGRHGSSSKYLCTYACSYLVGTSLVSLNLDIDDNKNKLTLPVVEKTEQNQIVQHRYCYLHTLEVHTFTYMDNQGETITQTSQDNVRWFANKWSHGSGKWYLVEISYLGNENTKVMSLSLEVHADIRQKYRSPTSLVVDELKEVEERKVEKTLCQRKFPIRKLYFNHKKSISWIVDNDATNELVVPNTWNVDNTTPLFNYVSVCSKGLFRS